MAIVLTRKMFHLSSEPWWHVSGMEVTFHAFITTELDWGGCQCHIVNSSKH
jgi:hypothetical protein